MTKTAKRETEGSDYLSEVVKKIEGKFGKGTILVGGSFASDRSKVVSFPTGCLSSDYASSLGGWPRGRLIEIYGVEGSGKTTLFFLAVAAAQKRGELCAYIDVEHALDPRWAEMCGVDMSKLILAQPECAEDALGVVQMLSTDGKVALIGLDSVAALVFKAELTEDGKDRGKAVDFTDTGFPIGARILSGYWRKLTAVLGQHKYTTVVAINHLMEKVGKVYGDRKTTPGGKSLKYYSSMRVEVTRTGWVKDGEHNKIGTYTKIYYSKNKVGTPHGNFEFVFMSGQGIDRNQEIIDLGKAFNIIKREGKALLVEGEEIAPNETELRKKLKQDQSLRDGLHKAVAAHIQENRGKTLFTKPEGLADEDEGQERDTE